MSKSPQILVVATTFSLEELTELTGCLQRVRCHPVMVDDLSTVHTPSTASLVIFGACRVDFQRLAEGVRTLRGIAADIPIVVILDARVTLASEVLMDLHIDDFVVAPLNPVDLRLRIERLIGRPEDAQRDELDRARHNLLSHFATRQFIGRSAAFLAVVEKIPRLAACDATVLLSGETGSGKEMCARAIHYVSPRASGPFVTLDCGSIPVDLFENELFGHESGAFTDARGRRPGLIAEAQSGTLLLDEVDSLPASAQVKLLRLLQDRQYKPLGAPHFRHADVRIIAATNQDLLEKVRQGTFREDLYYRLRVLSLSLPPLRQRRQDVPLLACHFLTIVANEYRRARCRFSSEALQKLASYSWPGNIRELENLVRQLVVLAEGPTIEASDIPLGEDIETADPRRQPFKIAKARVVEAFERSYLQAVLAACGGNISLAARQAKKNRRAFFGLLKKHGLTQSHRRTA